MIWQDGPVTVHLGDALTVLREMPAESVHCVVTSPPYWGLRDYNAPGQLGLEPTPELYVEHMVEVFREVRRVLRRDGTCWVNLGDSYATNSASHTYDGMPALAEQYRGGSKTLDQVTKPARSLAGLKPKDLVGVPWRVAFALQADGWWLRSDVVWSKPNPMPESVSDRPTKSHEYVFLLTKSARYYYDADAVREPATGHNPGSLGTHNGNKFDRSAGNTNGLGNSTLHTLSTGRNLRSVWTIATQPYPEAHFATFPEDLVIPCIKAGTSEHGCCPECGAPWRRITSTEYVKSPVHGNGSVVGRHYATGQNNFDGAGMPRVNKQVSTTGWQATCSHGREPISCSVLDPFAGSGTTLAVARRLGRRAIGIELQADYLPLIQTRVGEAALPLLEAIL